MQQTKVGKAQARKDISELVAKAKEFNELTKRLLVGGVIENINDDLWFKYNNKYNKLLIDSKSDKFLQALQELADSFTEANK